MFIGNRCSHAHIKGGWPGQIRFKMAGKFKTTCTTSQRIADITHSQSECLQGVTVLTDEYNA